MGAALPDRLAWVLGRLDVAPGDHVLEIGCGTGTAAAGLARSLTSGTVTALDRSAAQIATARRAHAAYADRVTFVHTPLAGAGLPEGRFDVAFAVNVGLFWADSTPDLQPLRRALAPGGRLYVVHQPPTPAKLQPAADRTRALLERNGFTVLAVHLDPLPPGGASCVVTTPSTP